MATPLLTVSVALESGTVLRAGDAILVTWEFDDNSHWNKSKSLDIKLLDDADNILFNNEPIGDNIQSRTSGADDDEDLVPNVFRWEIPLGLAAGDYKIWVHQNTFGGNKTNTNPPGRGGVSDVFTVASAWTLTIDDPPDANDDWVQGTQETVTWTATNIGVTEEFDLYIRKYGAGNDEWIEVAPGLTPGADASYVWTIDSALPPGLYEMGFIKDDSDYDKTNDSHYAIMDGSDRYFTINARSITITAPIANQRIPQSDTIDITWTQVGYDQAGVDNNIIIYYRDTVTDELTEITSSTDAADETYSWEVPADIGDYQIVIHDSYFDDPNNPVDEYVSGIFFVVEKSVTFLTPSPGGGTIIYVGQTGSTRNYEITWSYTGYDGTQNIDIYIKKTDAAWPGTKITDTEKLSDGTFTWAVDDEQAIDAYNMRMVVTDDGADNWPATDFVFVTSNKLLDFNALQRKTVLILVTDNQVFYEDVATHTITPISGATVELTSHVAIIPAYQKAFIADGTFEGFYYVDLANVKITGTMTGTLTKGDRLVGDDSGAIVIYDRGTANTMYGYRLISTAITEGVDNLKLDDNNYFDVTAVTEPPHWLTWSADSGKGSLPDSANIGTLYRGRIVLAGDESNPHMWYMSRQGDPFDWLYAQDDAQSAIAGSDGDAGEVGDVITALIPYHDELLLIGCARELWLMRGDPNAGGTLDSLTTGDGIFGPRSWCFDSNNNLYFVGLGGVYQLEPGTTTPVNLTANKIPAFMDGISRNTHWITMAHDIRRHGILIFITNVDDDSDDYGQCVTYWFSLATRGFFPENYPHDAGVFSALYYGAEDGAYEVMMVGCRDGYVRTYDEDQKSDIGTADNEIAIDSVALYPPQRLNIIGRSGKFKTVTITTGGGDSDSDSVIWEVYVADTAQEIIDNSVTDNMSNAYGVTDGVIRDKQTVDRTGIYGAVQLVGSNTVGESWAAESIFADIVDGGGV